MWGKINSYNENAPEVGGFFEKKQTMLIELLNKADKILD